MKTVLIVDDDAAVLAALTHLFTLGGFAVLSANDGQTGITLATTHAVDAALVDVNMPVMDGFQVCRKLREHACAKALYLPILLMTGRHSPELADHAAAIGATALLRKPFDVFALLKTVDALTGNSRAAEAATRTGGNTPALWNASLGDATNDPFGVTTRAEASL